ncbi:alpha/beta fold hydrolase [Streptomyces sp. NPDC005791]|uniref:alpha/beta fold hydrolase n=1 Tax=Streptomyces sp. NPDC005791 TaxID=3364732 RepID=UPI0036AF7DA4
MGRARPRAGPARRPGARHPLLLVRLAPVLICWGAEDTWIPVARGHELAGLIPGAELRLIEGAGHLVQEDAPAELTAALVRFLRTAAP